MMRSLYSGISGLRNHQTRMDVIGNNVSNVNTTGFKASRTIFQDIFSQTLSSGMSNTGTSGGTNPVQIGLGIRLSTIDVMHTGAPFGRTDNPFDMMIENEGFFIVQDSTGGNFFTRVGNFGIDNQGYLVSSEGLFVMGFGPNWDNVVMANPDGSPPADPSAIVFHPATVGVPAFTGTLLPGFVSTQSSVRLLADDGSGARVDIHGNVVPAGTGWVGGIVSQPATALAASGGYPGVGWVSSGVLAPNFTDNPDEVRAAINGTLLSGFVTEPSAQRLLALPDGTGWLDGAASIPVVQERPAWIEFPPVEFWNMETIQPIRLRVEHSTGGDFVDLLGFTVANNGTISVIMNNLRVDIAQLGLALFSNVNGLERAGNSLWRETASSGESLITRAGEDGAGTVRGGGLEMSNVDLAAEFTDMIVTQRGYQANSRIITVSDSLLEELVNLKR